MFNGSNEQPATPSQAQIVADQEQANKAVVKRIFDEVWNGRQLYLADELISSKLKDHYALPGQAPGAAGLKQKVTLYSTAIPDLKMNITFLMAENDKVACRFFSTGTSLGNFGDIKPTGKPIKMTGIIVYRMEDGQVMEVWENWDFFGLLSQLGAFEWPDAPPLPYSNDPKNPGG